MMTEGIEKEPVPAVQMNSTVQAARQRVRGPTISEKRLKAARDAEAAAVVQKPDRKPSAGDAVQMPQCNRSYVDGEPH